ncbi:glycosyltransferase family 2 protein [Ruixingdingia sedimenti]|uniref:Glycosyltransferase family 2 protein n=1 Tax=Ruixingdingia sedimenti TaxID=3073604 RepID=A0ABU1F8S8_9RHOB|nr:glycosyltransferase family 2 protein [Xinfangfangia sp. LG-4]MDR5652847.1 glycosyltransferase family 2 protein [Xinfangfangia sp. LG-4]
MAEPTVLAVILNWRTAPMTLRAAECCLTAMEGIAGAITIVDNDSGDGSYEALVQAVADRGWHRVRVIQSGHNGGFGAGNNVGIRAGLPGGEKPDFVYILNSDAFPAPDAIRQLLDYLLAHPHVGFAGSHIHGPEGDPHTTAFRFPSAWSELEGAARTGPISRALARHTVPMALPRHPARVDWLAGASMMMRRTVLDRIGLFDETFFLYFEETDLCLRARRAGWETHYIPASRVAHIGSESTGMKRWTRIPQYWLDSRLHYFVKNHGAMGAMAATLAHVAGGLVWRARRLVAGRPRLDPPHFLRDLIVHDAKAGLRALTQPRRAPARQTAGKSPARRP